MGAYLRGFGTVTSSNTPPLRPRTANNQLTLSRTGKLLELDTFNYTFRVRYQILLLEGDHMKQAKYYSVKVIQFTAPNAYHVICDSDRITHSMWPSYELAMQCMRDLNKMERRKISLLRAVA